jgi:hypothetical protein
VVSRRLPDDVEEASLGPGRVIIACRLASAPPPPSAPGSAAPGPVTGGPGAPGSAAAGPVTGGPGAPGSGPPSPDTAGTMELALAEPALTGLLAWLEAAPPGSHLS